MLFPLEWVVGGGVSSLHPPIISWINNFDGAAVDSFDPITLSFGIHVGASHSTDAMGVVLQSLFNRRICTIKWYDIRMYVQQRIIHSHQWKQQEMRVVCVCPCVVVVVSISHPPEYVAQKHNTLVPGDPVYNRFVLHKYSFYNCRILCGQNIFVYKISIPKMLWQFGKFDIFAFIISCPRKFFYYPNFNFQLFCWRYDKASVAGPGIAIEY